MSLRRQVFRVLLASIFWLESMSLAHMASARVVWLDFEGVAPYPNNNNVEILDFYNGGTSSIGTSGTNYGVSFDPGALLICLNTSAASCSNVSNGGIDPGTQEGALFFLNGSAINLNYSTGFDTGFSFTYTSPFIGGGQVDVFSDLNGGGANLGSFSFPLTQAAGCDPTYSWGASYCPFESVGVSFSGIAKSVVFSGVANFVAFDNITFGSANAVTSQTNIDQANPFYLASNIGGSVLPVFQGGTLQIDIAGAYADNFTLDTSVTSTIDANGNSAVFSGIFSDANFDGNIAIADGIGGGSITFSGVNTYTGSTTINVGARLDLSGVGSIATSAALMNDGVFDISAATSGAYVKTLSGSGIVSLGSKSLVLTSAVGNFSGIISGYGGLAISAGTETLTGANTYSGGTVIDPGATLQVGAGGAIGSIVGDILDNGALVISRSDDLTLPGVVSGTGSLTKTGAGVLTLTGANIYTGGTTVSAGGLTGTATSLQGAVLNNAAVTFAQATDGTYAGVMSGTGSLTKTGAGVLTLTSVSSITGVTTVQTGTLSLQGRLGTSALTVASGATLRGTGTVLGNLIISNGGTLAPGNSPGTLTVAGNVTMNAGAVHSVDIDGGVYSALGGAGSYDRLVLTGASSVYSAAGTISLKLRGITGVATNSHTSSIGDRFTIVTANTIAGNFSSVSQPTAGMVPNSRFDVLYNAGDIELVVTPDSFKNFSQAAGARLNVVNVAGVLDAWRPAAGSRATGDLGGLFNGIYGLKSDQLPAAMEALSGKVQADLVVSSLDNRRLGRAAAMKRLRSARTARVEHDSNVWVQVITQAENVNADLVADGYSNHANGYAIGVDHLFEGDFRLGFGHANVSGVVNAGVAGTARDSSQQVFLYGSWQPTADYFVDANLAYAWSGYNTRRSVELRTGAYSYGSHDRTYNWAGDISVGRRIVTDGYIVEPSAGIRWDQLNRGAVSESGNSIAALNLAAKRDEAVQGKAGVSLSKGFATGNLEWVPEVHGYFLPRLSGNAMFIQRAQLAGLNIVTSSVQKSSGSALVGSGVRVNLTNTAHIFLDYDAHLQGGQPAIHSVSGGLSVNF